MLSAMESNAPLGLTVVDRVCPPDESGGYRHGVLSGRNAQKIRFDMCIDFWR